MKKQNLTAVIDLGRVRKWVSIVNPYFMAVRLPEVFEEMGFPIDIVRKYIRRHRRLRLNNSMVGNAYGVSDGEILVILAKNIGANTTDGDRFLCTSNKIRAWRDACLARLDEVGRQKS